MAKRKIRQVIIQRKHDLTGKRFGRLVVLKFYSNHIQGRPNGRYWECACDCGNTNIVRGTNLKYGNSLSCGCGSSRHNAADINRTHGETSGWKHKVNQRTTEYQTWMGMKRRCYDKNMQNYGRYGGRGIKVCDRWLYGTEILTAFECFLEDMGRKPSVGLSLDRIDNMGNYDPGNCRWATLATQIKNRRKPMPRT